MKKISSLLVTTVFLCLACGEKTMEAPATDSTVGDSLNAMLLGDSTVYGLACDGCTDTMLVFLPLSDISQSPDTFYILDATKHHRVFGHLKVGDRIAVLRNATDTTVADFVIDMNMLQGTWCYQVMPTLKRRAGMDQLSQKQLISNLSDSLKQILMTPHEIGMQIKGDNTVRPIGTSYTNMGKETDSPVEYPKTKRYRQWRLYNGKLLLTAMAIDSLGNSYATGTDTADFVLMHRDTLVLRFTDGNQGYYRKEE